MSRLFVTALIFLLSPAYARTRNAEPTPLPKKDAPAASPVPASPAPSPAPSATPLTAVASKALLKEFQRAQVNELKAAEHQHRSMLKELKASQAARQKEWEHKEKDARHKYFAEHAKGPERRAYITDFLDRRKAFLQLLSDEAVRRNQEREVRLRSLKEDQIARLKEFQDALQKGEKPGEGLWPTGH